LHTRIENLYNCGCDDCEGKSSQLNLSISDSFKDLLNTGKKAFKHLHEKGSYNPKDLQTEQVYKDLMNQTFEAFNFAISDNDMPEVMRTALQDDARLFGGLKTHAQLFEASKLLLDDKGNLKPFSQLSKEFDKLNITYNENYLEAEYEFAIGSSQMAAKWDEFSDNERYELNYRTAGDGKVRPEHAALNGITLPKSDPFWLYYTPLNGWKCRCTAVEVLKGKYPTSDSEKAITAGEKATTQIGKDGKNRLEIFRFNPGAQKVVFPPAHPYTKIAGASVVKKQMKK
jgi:SPP1 gp7 family putative phage head morphogenesis protein